MARQEQRAETRIDRLAAGGDGIGRLPDGRVLFVPFTAPGDRVRVRVVEARRRFARGEVLEVLEAGPGRSEPHCPVFGQCGGCRWQHLEYATQLEAKRRIIVDAATRIAGMSPPAEVRITPSPAPYGYRLRARLLSRRGEVGYRHWRSHELCGVGACPVLTPELNAELAGLVDRVARANPSARIEDEEWELLSGEEGCRSIRVGPDSSGDALTLRCGDDTLRISPLVFTQGNALLLDGLRDAVVSAAAPTAAQSGDANARAVEIYAGAGLFSVPLARLYAQLDAIEANPHAARDLEHNLGVGCPGRTWRVHAVPAEQGLGDLVSERAEVSVLVLDPPRVGVFEPALDAIIALAPRPIVYLSCDPATLARDLARLAPAGYALRSLEGFDLFPQTAHVEALAVLELGTPLREVP
jgi:23S rRNA (uracil1939-C5)-methyltransferase